MSNESYTKADWVLCSIQCLFNRTIRWFFPTWNQKAIDELVDSPRLLVQRAALLFVMGLTSRNPPGVEYTNDIGTMSFERAVADQWCINLIDLERYPSVTVLWTMLAAGTLTPAQYRFYKGTVMSHDLAWQDGKYEHLPPLTANFENEDLDVTAHTNEILAEHYS